MKKIIATLLLCAPLVSYAQIEITEVMYDLEGSDSGYEWVEVYNSGTEPVVLTDWKLFEANINHRISAIEGGSETVGSGEYAVIVDNEAKFKEKYPAYSGTLFDSAFSLSNSGETIIMRDGDLIDQDTFTYTSDLGASGDGESLHKIDGVVQSGVVSLGAGSGQQQENATSTNPATETPQGSGSLSSHSGSATITTLQEKNIFSVDTGRHRLVSENTPIVFEAQFTKGIGSAQPRFAWSLGDGSMKMGEVVEHVYQFAGVYTVVLNAQMGDQKAVSRTKVTVVKPHVAITKATRDYVEIENTSEHELNLDHWQLQTNNRAFTFPTDTILEPHVAVKFPNKVTGILYNFGKRIALHNPMNHAMALFSVPTIAEINAVVGTTTPNEPQSTVARVSDLLQKLAVLEGALEELKRVYTLND